MRDSCYCIHVTAYFEVTAISGWVPDQVSWRAHEMVALSAGGHTTRSHVPSSHVVSALVGHFSSLTVTADRLSPPKSVRCRANRLQSPACRPNRRPPSVDVAKFRNWYQSARRGGTTCPQHIRCKKFPAIDALARINLRDMNICRRVVAHHRCADESCVSKFRVCATSNVAGICLMTIK